MGAEKVWRHLCAWDEGAVGAHARSAPEAHPAFPAAPVARARSHATCALCTLQPSAATASRRWRGRRPLAAAAAAARGRARAQGACTRRRDRGARRVPRDAAAHVRAAAQLFRRAARRRRMHAHVRPVRGDASCLPGRPTRPAARHRARSVEATRARLAGTSVAPRPAARGAPSRRTGPLRSRAGRYLRRGTRRHSRDRRVARHRRERGGRVHARQGTEALVRDARDGV